MLNKAFKLSFLSATLAVSALAAANNQMIIEHLPHIQHAGNITVSANGGVTAYTLASPRNLLNGDDDARADTHLYVMRDGKAPVKFVGGHGSVSALQFSADNQSLFFKSKRDDDEHTSLYSISLDGGEAQKRYSYDTAIGDYEVASDGKTLYFVAKEKDNAPDLEDKGFKAYAYEEDDRLNRLWTVDLSDTDSEPSKLYSDGHVSNFDLSDDGKVIVTAVAPTNLIDDFYMQRDLVVLNAETGEETNRIDIPGKLGGYEISPNGKHIAFNAGTDIHDSSTGVLMLAKVDSPEFTQLTADLPQHIVDVDWLGKDILSVVHRGVETDLVVYKTNGEEKRTIKTSSDIAVRSADVGDGEIRFIADSPAHPREVFSVERRSSKKVSNHNTWLADIELHQQSTFSYKARDGESIEGLLITPNGDAPAEGWPMILAVHGGPEAHFSDGWITRYSEPGQFAASMGYAVYYPNYRGSTGRGVAFAKQHQDDYAGKEFNDLVDGVKALADAGVINKDRVGITGGSYGGYASMWGATALTEHFAAAVAFVGISNQVSKFGTSDIPKEMHLVHSLKWPWEDNWMNLIERSPIFHAGKSTTPILIMHGENDTRVHPSQSMELYRSIKVRTETPVRLVFYPGEGHGNRKAAAQFDYALRLMRWMDTYLAVDATRKDPMPEFDLDMENRLKQDDDKADESDGESAKD